MQTDSSPDQHQPADTNPLAEYQYAIGPESDVLRRAPAVTGSLSEPEPPPDECRQFSLGQLLGATVVIALFMAPAQFLSPPVYAGLMGIFTLVFLGLWTLYELRGALVLVAFLMLLTAYGVASWMAAGF